MLNNGCLLRSTSFLFVSLPLASFAHSVFLPFVPSFCRSVGRSFVCSLVGIILLAGVFLYNNNSLLLFVSFYVGSFFSFSRIIIRIIVIRKIILIMVD